MVFGRSNNRHQPSLDQHGHNYDANMLTPYQPGPSDQSYLTDPTHPDYDPMVDPNLQLRTVRTAAASIAESHRSEQRRDDRRKAKKMAKQNSISGKLFRGRTLRKEKKESSAIASMVSEEVGRKRGSGAMGTGGEGVGVPFDSAQQDKKPYAPTADAEPRAWEEAELEDQERRSDDALSAPQPTGPTMKKVKPKRRRNVYVNVQPPQSELQRNGDPIVTYPRNKVRTSKYTIVTFLPRFLFEQFRRVANIYFLGLVVLQVFPTFGATIPQIAMLPLVAILTITAIKDSIEDYRRHVLDNTVNNSAVTRLGNWRNVNQARDARGFLRRTFGLAGRGNAKVSKGVKKLREKEDAIGMREVSGSRSGSAARYGDVEEFSGNHRNHMGRSDSINSSNALHTIVSESERDDMSLRNAGTQQSFDRAGGVATNATAQATAYSVGHASNAEGVVDYRRHTPGTAKWERTLWKKLEVGDIVLLREDDQVPADMIILNTSDPDGNAYVETKNLDGETNLKPRKSLKATMSIQSEEDLEHARFVIDSEPPHANLYSYNGLLKYTASGSGDPKEGGEGYSDGIDTFPPDSSAYAAAQHQARRTEPVTINELLLRGCSLRNTEWVIGLVVFTGEDTKIMLNSGETPSKRSKIEKETNFNVIVNFLILMVLCILCAVIGGLRLYSDDASRNFYEVGGEVSDNNIVNALIILGSCLVVFQNIVPISLYISIEIVKTIQAYFIYQDIEMYYEPLDYPCVPKTWNISDDLGQIEYIFSDKTGTLTQNVMEFKKCSINGVSYGEGITEAMIGAMKREGKDVSGFSAERQEAELDEAREKMVQIMSKAFKNRYLRPDQVTLISPPLAEVLASNHQNPQRKDVVTFFRALALCHTALTDRPDGSNPFLVDYKAESPDEAALVSAARDAGAVFIGKNNTNIDIEVVGQPERYTPLKVLEFNSTRKRMSVIVREPDGKILMITKGADSIIYQRLRADHPEELKQSTQKHLEEFANAGLRTLCIAYRYLDEREYADWARIHDEAAASLTDRDEAIDAANEQIEVNLTLLGATALEDKLQVGVPEAIATLHRAGIKLWILTGDKLQTAIEIGFSCNLLSSNMEIMIISADHEAGTRAQIEAACNKIAAAGRPVVYEEPAGPGRKAKKTKLDMKPTEAAPKDGFAVVIDGETLRYALDDKLKPLFLALTTQCEAVVCCRVSPAQKALTVKLVKDGKNAMTLAIGDGANDVAMIQEAHCGVGIAGLEGAQASMSADYAVGQFRFLTRLLLVHGQLCYHRIADLHKVFFYKNIIWTSIMFYFQIHCDFTGSYVFDYTFVLLYNLVFSSLCVIVIGALDQVVNAGALAHFPQTYKRGVQGKEYTKTLFYISMIDAAYQGAVCYFIPWWFWTYAPMVGSDGQDMSAINFFGTSIAAAAVTTANLYAGLIAKHWTAIFWIVEVISLLSVYVWILVYSAFPVFAYQNVGYYVMQTIAFWAIVLLITVVSLLPRFFARAWRSSFHPNELDIVREAWVKGGLKDDLNIPHRKAKKNRVRSNRDVERNQDNLFYAAKRSTERQKGALHPDIDEISETSADPFPTHDYEQRYDNKRQHQQYLPPSSGSPDADRNGAVSGLSFYDPDQLPGRPTPQLFGGANQAQQRQNQAAYGGGPYGNQSPSASNYARPDVPLINVQRASGSMYGYDPSLAATPSSSNDQPPIHVAAAGYGGPNHTHPRPEGSADSFSRAFDEAFADEYTSAYPEAAGGFQHRQAAATVTAAPSYASRYHDRFKTGPASPPVEDGDSFAGGYSDPNVGSLPTEGSGGLAAAATSSHVQEGSAAASEISWHTADGDYGRSTH
ncbi:phospholipid transporting ATPase [Thecaphora frezii]